MAPRKLKILSVADKLELIREVEKGEKSKSLIAIQFGIPKSTLSTIIKNKMKIIASTAEGKSVHRYRQKLPQHSDVEKCLIKWFQETRKNNIPVNGPLLQQKAKEFASSLGHEFAASSGWLSNFKKRYGIAGRTLSGESASVNEDTCAEWLAHLSDLLETYTSDEIYNADETGLFYRCLPNKTLDFKNTDCHGGKESKERLTVLLAVNMSGSVKHVPCVIGKSLKPRCFKNVKTFPTEYTANSRAWMTGIIFREWLQKWDNELTKKKKRALLFIDNCPAHNPLPVLISLKVEFLPPNTTSKLQPLDLGIIKNFKVKYRTEVVNHVLRQIQENRAVVPINVLEALHFIKKAWDEVSPRTIQNCFSACGFDVITTDESDTALENPEEVEIDGWGILSSVFDVDAKFNEFVEVDCDLPVCFPPTDESIVREVLGREEEDDAGLDNLEDPEIEPPTPPTVQEARQAIDTIRCFLESSEDIEYDIFRKLNEISSVVSKLEKKRLKQMKINDFFKPV